MAGRAFGFFVDERMVQEPHQRAPRAPSTPFLVLLLLVVYNSNFRTIHTNDSTPARLLPFCLLIERRVYLDGWIEPYWPQGDPRRAYFSTHARGHWLSVYPIIASVAITPLYVLPAWWLSRQPAGMTGESLVRWTVVNTMEKISASLVAALSVGLLYLALRKVATPGASLTLALVYGLASNTWSISSQALWRQGFTELAFALLLWALLAREARKSFPFWAGLALALAVANKPAHAVVAAPFIAYFAKTNWKKLPLFFAPFLVVGLPVLAYNFYYFDRLLGAYPPPLGLYAESTELNAIGISWTNGIAGLAASPSRGLFVFMPWALYSVWGAARAWRAKTYGWERFLIVGIVADFLVHARLGTWWAGWCFGPRYLTDLLPFLAYFLLPVWPRIQGARLVRAAFSAAVAVAFLIQLVGAYYYPRGEWDAKPVTIEAEPKRLWDWRDTQIARSLKAGPAPPQMLYDWWVLFKLEEETPGGVGASR